MTLLTGDQLHLWRGETHVLRGLSFALEAGSCLQVTGANGAGKTSLLRCLCGLVPLESGSILWRGQSILADRYAFYAELAYLGHDNALKGDLYAAENLRYAIGMRRHVSEAQISAALQRVGIAADAPMLRQMSAGQRRRVALARVLLLECSLWLLDEPTSNLDAAGHALTLELLREHVEHGGAAIVATHRALDLPAPRLRDLVLQ